MRPVCYIAHPLRGDWPGNIASAKRYVQAAIQKGWAPIAPYILCDGLLDDSIEADRAAGLAVDLAQIPRCDILIACGPVISNGMKQEIDLARERGIIVWQIASPDDMLDAFAFRDDQWAGAYP